MVEVAGLHRSDHRALLVDFEEETVLAIKDCQKLSRGMSSLEAMADGGSGQRIKDAAAKALGTSVYINNNPANQVWQTGVVSSTCDSW